MSEDNQGPVDNTSTRIHRLKEELRHLEEEEVSEHKTYDNDYEDLLQKQPLLVHNVVEDILATRMDSIRATPVAQIPAILQYFEGNTMRQKRDSLIRFLQTCPAYKTTDTKLIQQRFDRLRRAAQYSRDAGMDADGFFSFIKSKGFII